MYQQIYYSIELTRKLELLSKNYFLKERESEEHLPSCFALTDFGEEEEIVFFIFCTIQNPYFTLVRTTNNMLYSMNYEEVQNIVPSCDCWGLFKKRSKFRDLSWHRRNVAVTFRFPQSYKHDRHVNSE